MRRTPLGLLVLTIAMLLGTVSANATKQVAATFGVSCADSSACGDGEFAGAGPIAVRDSTGQVFVIDVGNGRVERFSATGAYQAQFATTATNGIAIDQSNGDLYLVDQANNVIDKYSSTGVLLGTVGTACAAGPCGDGELSSPSGVAVDPTNGNVLIADTTNNRIQRFTAAGTYVSQFGGSGNFTSPGRVAVDASGRIIVLDAGTGRVKRFSANGSSADLLVDSPGPIAAPSELTIDSTNNHFYIAAYTADFSSNGIFEFDDTGAFVDQHAPNAIGPVGLTIRSSTGRIYASSGDTIFAIDNTTPPILTVSAPTAMSGEAAVLHGTVDPQGGMPVSWSFELSADGGATWTPQPGGGTEAAAGPAVVSDAVDALTPNTSYLVRLAGAPQYAPITFSPSISFSTSRVAPELDSLAVLDVGTSSATLRVGINARHDATSYRFEVGTSLNYGTNIPAVDASAGSGVDPVEHEQQLTGLNSNTLYHARAVATNSAGEVTGPDVTFRTSSSSTDSSSPDGRVYEKVSPDDKNGADVLSLGELSFAAADGNRVSYGSRGGFADAWGSGLLGQVEYVATRGANGWGSRAVTPRPPPEAFQGAILDTVVPLFSADLSKAVVKAYDLPNVDGDLPHTANLYLEDTATRNLRVLSQNPAGGAIGLYGVDAGLRGWSPDLRHVTFETASNLVNGAVGSDTKLYEWNDGVLRLVGVLPDGTVPAGPVESPDDVGSVEFQRFQRWHGDVVSEDGSRVLFGARNGGSNPQLLSRIDGSRTELISQSEASAPSADPAGVKFDGASPDGRSIVFSSDTPLVDADPGTPGKALYLFRDSAQPSSDRNLTFLSRGASADLSGNSETANGFAGMSNDGGYVYFVANGVLHRWHDGDDRTIAGPIPQDVRSADSLQLLVNAPRVSHDGRRLAFTQDGQGAAISQSAGPARPAMAMYVYDDVDGTESCVSCPSNGASAQHDVRVRQSGDGSEGHNSGTAEQMRARYLTPDGRRVFFTTADELVPADINGHADVYEYDVDAKQLHLISGGHGAASADFVDASASGDDVFFTSRNRLVDADTDDSYDLYDARVGGSVLSVRRDPPCTDACQAVPAGTGLSTDHIGSAFTSDRAQPLVPKRPSLAITALSAMQRRRLASVGRATLSFRVTTPGRVVVTVRAAIGGSWRRVGKAQRLITKAGRSSISIRLPTSALRRLSRTGRLRTKLTVTFTGVREPKLLSLTLLKPNDTVRRSSTARTA